jgi:beta-aspartyl-peptidase (threonine type)
MDYVLAIHGGAGTINPGVDETPYHAALKAAAAAGEAVLAAGGSALDAVSTAVVELENCMLFNAARGAVYTSDAVQEMDAIIMDGANLAAGAVAGIRTVKNPVLLARAVMEKSGCVLIMGEGAERFAREQGFPVTPPEYFASKIRLNQLRRAQKAGSCSLLDHDGGNGTDDEVDADLNDDMSTEPIHPDTKYGTVGAVARDRFGNLASAVSTGGMTNKRPGRVGDTPIVGAGCYAGNASVAVASTGTGEHFIRTVLAYDVAARMQYSGATLAEAATAAVHETLTGIGGEGGIIAISHDGSVAMQFNTSGMYRASVRENEAIVTAVFS